MNNYNRDVGYKIKIKGKVSAQEVIEILAAELLNLQENFGVEEFSGVNFYCQMYKDDENQTLISNKTGEEICGVVVESKNKHKTINKIDNSKKIISYNKSIDFENLEKSVSSLIDNTFIISDNYNLLSSYKSKAEINRIEEERRKNFAELREKEQRQRTFEKEIQIKKQKRRKRIYFKI